MLSSRILSFLINSTGMIWFLAKRHACRHSRIRASQQRRAGRRDISIASGKEPEDDDGAMTEDPILIFIIGISARRSQPTEICCRAFCLPMHTRSRRAA
ncbi:hypothetical protein B5K05_23670 [Rhizobium phaseoli]|nr:hypothetical protein RPHASCH2410_PD04250 [Rhizobium phaseoli Ch24-10]RDJ04689.1 hypothetical protein B5K04_23605 [Rhizobium phaseoli]RDJ07021.1 hypothetical protein B5K05_23670 [Rhizobium phaseoli]